MARKRDRQRPARRGAGRGRGGVHLGGESLPAREVVRWLPGRKCSGGFSGRSFLPQPGGSARGGTGRRELHFFRAGFRNAIEAIFRPAAGNRVARGGLPQRENSRDRDRRSERRQRRGMHARRSGGNRGDSIVPGSRQAGELKDAIARLHGLHNGLSGAGRLRAEPAATGCQPSTWSQITLITAVMGIARINPIAPHIHPQKRAKR